MLDLNQSNILFPHPPHLEKEAALILKHLEGFKLKDYVLLFSSGTTSTTPKGYGIKKSALIENADAVNRHFQLSHLDTWGLSLPSYHVGGLSVLIRAMRTGSRVVDLGKWDPISWREKINNENITITTIVPTQLYDLVSLNLTSPSGLKYLIVGGDYLSEELRVRARALGWPVLRTFGMTEVGSQLASQKAPDGPLDLLDIHQIKTDSDMRLWVRTPSLFDFEFKLGEKFEIQFAQDEFDQEGFFPTKDRAILENKCFTHLGRLDDQLKIAGRLVSLFELKEKLSRFALQHNLFGKVELIFEDDQRKGKKIVVLHLPEIQLSSDILSPFTFETREVTSFARTDLGKLKI